MVAPRAASCPDCWRLTIEEAVCEQQQQPHFRLYGCVTMLSVSLALCSCPDSEDPLSLRIESFLFFIWSFLFF